VTTILDDWDVTPEYLTRVVRENPSLRGMVLGYIAERKIRDIFERDPRASGLRKDDDHDRKRKGDLVCTYRGREFIIEVKSLQTNSIVMHVGDESHKKIIQVNGKYVECDRYQELWPKHRDTATFTGCVQCDASDRREIVLPNTVRVLTTCLAVGEFDILAAGIFGFRHHWDFAFALNRELPRTTSKRYDPECQQFLLKSLMPVSWPVAPPFTRDPFALMDRIIDER
jgi:hypothetical protein